MIIIVKQSNKCSKIDEILKDLIIYNMEENELDDIMIYSDYDADTPVVIEKMQSDYTNEVSYWQSWVTLNA